MPRLRTLRCGLHMPPLGLLTAARDINTAWRESGHAQVVQGDIGMCVLLDTACADQSHHLQNPAGHNYMQSFGGAMHNTW